MTSEHPKTEEASEDVRSSVIPAHDRRSVTHGESSMGSTPTHKLKLFKKGKKRDNQTGELILMRNSELFRSSVDSRPPKPQTLSLQGDSPTSK